MNAVSYTHLIIYNQAREIIFNVFKFMREEVVEGIKILIKSVLERYFRQLLACYLLSHKRETNYKCVWDR